MSALTLTGVVVNVLDVPLSKNKEGEAYGGFSQVQIMAEDVLQNGEKRMNLHTFKIDDRTPFEKAVSQRVRVPVGCFANGKAIVFYMPRGSSVEVL
jgi:hypothetical protein